MMTYSAGTKLDISIPDSTINKLEAKKNAAGEVDNKTKSEMIVKILSTMSRNLNAEIATIKEEEE